MISGIIKFMLLCFVLIVCFAMFGGYEGVLIFFILLLAARLAIYFFSTPQP